MAAMAQTNRVDNIDPLNKNYADLEFLKNELRHKRIVMLGEPSHQEGNVFLAKVRLIKFLHEKMGFNVIAFESGFFELQQAQEEIDKGGEVTKSLDKALFPIWTSSKQFIPLIDYINEQKSSLKIVGFDPQFSATQGNNFLPILKQFVLKHKQAYNLNDILLAEVVESLSEGIFPDGVEYSSFLSEIVKARKTILRISKEDPSSAEIWLQNIKSIESLAADYYQNKPGEKNIESFKARDSNPRDRQMADNLVFWSKKYPAEKIICWGATLHFTDQPELLENEELKGYKPMGRWVRETFGSDMVYTLGTVSKSGSYAAWFQKEPKMVPPIASGSIEEQLGNIGGDYLYLTGKELRMMGKQTTSMFDYIPISGDWSKVINGIMFFSEYTPSLAARSGIETPIVNSDNQNKIDQIHMIPNSRVVLKIRKTGAYMIKGNISDLDDGQPVAAATLQLLALKESAMTDGKGNFVLSSKKEPFGEMLKVSSIGYADTVLIVGLDEMNIKMKKNSIDLEDIQIRPSDGYADKIVRKAFSAIDKNLNPAPYGLQFYVNSKVSSIDSCLYHVEYTGNFSKLKNSRDRYLSKVLQLHWIKRSSSTLPSIKNGLRYLDGYMHINGGNPVLQHPMFNSADLGKFRYEVLEELSDSYLIAFESRTRSHSFTNGYYLKSFSGTMLINKYDDAILKTTLKYKLDTTTLNRFARNYDKKGGEEQTIFINILDQDQVEVATDYVKFADGYYYPQQTSILREQTGRYLQDNHPMYLKSETKVRFMEALKDANQGSYRKTLDINHLKYNSSFWNSYQRPQ